MTLPDTMTPVLTRFRAVGLWALLVTLGVMMALPAALTAQDAPPASNGEPTGSILVENLNFNEARIEQVLSSLTNRTGVPITAYGTVPGERVSIIERSAELEDVINKIAVPKGWVWFREDDGRGYGIADEAWYKANILPKKVITKIFRPDHVKAVDLERYVRPMLTPGISSATPDERTNKLIVMDLPEVIERIERLIREVDVQLMIRVFYIRNADVSEIAQKIESYKSDPGTIEVDTKTRQIIVTDLLSNIKKMELLIDILDIGPEIVIYDVNNIGIDGTDLEELKTIIDSVRTKSEDLLFEINNKAGVFILEDVPEVHERVEQILAGFDQPVKQVLIQGEILSSAFSREFSLGVNRAVWASRDFTNPGSVVGSNSPFASLLPGANTSALAFSGDTISGAALGRQAFLEWEAKFKDTDAKVLLQPRLLVKNQEISRIFVGSEEPFLSTFFNDNVTGGTTRSTSQQFVTSGLRFEISPSISNSLLVEMEIKIDNDDAQPLSELIEGQRLIRKDRQNVETVLTIPSGETRAIGGLITNSTSRTDSGLPFLVKIPILGHLFGNKSSTRIRNNLQLFITPTVVEDIIPRMSGVDGKRGRLVTERDRLFGSFDVNADAMIADPEDLFVEDTDLLSPLSGDSEATIDELLRELTPREREDLERDSSFDFRQGGTPPPTQPVGRPVTAPPSDQQQQPERPAAGRPAPESATTPPNRPTVETAF